MTTPHNSSRRCLISSAAFINTCERLIGFSSLHVGNAACAFSIKAVISSFVSIFLTEGTFDTAIAAAKSSRSFLIEKSR